MRDLSPYTKNHMITKKKLKTFGKEEERKLLHGQLDLNGKKGPQFCKDMLPHRFRRAAARKSISRQQCNKRTNQIGAIRTHSFMYEQQRDEIK